MNPSKTIQLQTMFLTMHTLMNNKDHREIDRWLKELDLEAEKGHPHLPVGLLRVTFRCRHNLSEWENCLAKVRAWMDEHELDQQLLLRGLVPAAPTTKENP